jgi:hypothetical protein
MESLTVSDHYTRSGMIERILAALAAEGKDVRGLTLEDLAPGDQSSAPA